MLWLQSLVSQLVALGVVLSDEKVIAKYLWAVFAKFVQIAISIETLIDLSSMFSLEDVTGRLKAVEDRAETAMMTADGRLLLTKWAARMRGRQYGEGSSLGGTGKHCGKAPQKKDDSDGFASSRQGHLSQMWEDRPLGPGLQESQESLTGG